MTPKPDISAILHAPFGVEEVARTISHLRAQTGPQIELVLLSPPRVDWSSFQFEPLLVKFVEVPERLPQNEALSLGVREASAPLVVLTEDHCFPQPGWADALVRAHQEPWYAVGPQSMNANRCSAMGQADFLVNFSEYAHNVEGPSSSVMGHNTSYKKERLLQFTPCELANFFRCEMLLHHMWGSERCLHQPQAQVSHVNISRPVPFLAHKIYGGVVFGGERCRGWSLGRRLIYIAGSWAIPLVRLIKLRSTLSKHSSEQQIDSWQTGVWVLTALIFHAFGEALGYIGGPALASKAYGRYSDFEQNRWRDVCAADLELLQDPAS